MTSSSTITIEEAVGLLERVAPLMASHWQQEFGQEPPSFKSCLFELQQHALNLGFGDEGNLFGPDEVPVAAQAVGHLSMKAKRTFFSKEWVYDEAMHEVAAVEDGGSDFSFAWGVLQVMTSQLKTCKSRKGTATAEYLAAHVVDLASWMLEQLGGGDEPEPTSPSTPPSTTKQEVEERLAAGEPPLKAFHAEVEKLLGLTSTSTAPSMETITPKETTMTETITTATLEVGFLILHPLEEDGTPWGVVHVAPAGSGQFIVELERGFDGERQQGLWPAATTWEWAHGFRIDDYKATKRGSGEVKWLERHPLPPVPAPAPEPKPKPKSKPLETYKDAEGRIWLLT